MTIQPQPISQKKPFKEEYYAPLQMKLKDAEQGDANAQRSLGDLYRFDKYLWPDYKKAAYWYGKAAEQGDADAQSSLAGLYSWGKGVPQNFEEAARWYGKAAEQGSAVDQRVMGFLYSFGKGVSQDYERAAQWFRKAAENRDDLARKILETVQLRVPGNSVVLEGIKVARFMGGL